MVRTLLIPEKKTISFDVPEEYIGTLIEVIAFAKNEGIARSQTTEKNTSFTVLHSDAKDYTFNREEANER